MTEDALLRIADRVEQLGHELRRQGRAAIGAQAAAEASLAAVEALAARLAGEPPPPTQGTDTSRDDAVATLQALLPVFDAMQRVAKEAEAAAALEPERAPVWPLTLIPKLRGSGADRLRSLRIAVRLLDSAFRQALEHLDLVIESRVGVEVDANLHRVVEARPASEAFPPNTVVEVVRCGYLRADAVIREADVVATRSAANT